MTAPINHLSLSHPRRLLSDGIEITCVSFDGPNVSVGKGSNVPSCAPFRGEGRVSSYLYNSQRPSTMKNIKTPKHPLSQSSTQLQPDRYHGSSICRRQHYPAPARCRCLFAYIWNRISSRNHHLDQWHQRGDCLRSPNDGCKWHAAQDHTS